MHLSKTLRQLLKKLGVSISQCAIGCGLPNSAMTNALSGRPLRPVTMKKLMSYPGLDSQEILLLAIAWVEDRRSEIGMTSEDFHLVPSTGEAFSRIVGDPSLVEALRHIGLKAKDNKKLYDLVMGLKDIV